jgi:glycerol-3-phosphate cytidylyltransferase
MKIGFTCSTFDLFHAGHVVMLEEAKRQCDYLIVGIQTDPTIDRSYKNRPVQSIVERQIQVKACKYVDEVIIYSSEKELEDLMRTLPIDVRIMGVEYIDKEYTGKQICYDRGIQIYFNRRDHSFSSSDLRQRVYEIEKQKKGLLCQQQVIFAPSVTPSSK